MVAGVAAMKLPVQAREQMLGVAAATATSSPKQRCWLACWVQRMACAQGVQAALGAVVWAASGRLLVAAVAWHQVDSRLGSYAGCVSTKVQPAGGTI